MTELDAKEFLRECAGIYRAIGNMDSVLSRWDESPEKDCYKKAIGDLLGGVTFDFVIPLTREFPGLNEAFERDARGVPRPLGTGEVAP